MKLNIIRAPVILNKHDIILGDKLTSPIKIWKLIYGEKLRSISAKSIGTISNEQQLKHKEHLRFSSTVFVESS